jgi:hypothetical protein
VSAGLEHIREVLRRLPVGELARAAVTNAEVAETQDCDHGHVELRVKTNAASARMFGLQCVRCGRVSGKWIPRQEALQRDANPPAWDEGLSDRFWETVHSRREDVRQRAVAARQTEWWDAYNAYLSTPAWKETRRRVLARANGVCEGCRDAPAAQVHHVDYAHVGDELLWELRAVCLACHDKAHDRAGAA